jgi:hypothetical protein
MANVYLEGSDVFRGQASAGGRALHQTSKQEEEIVLVG